MGTMLVRTLISQASKYLNDQTNVNWDRDTLLDWLNLSESAIILMKPDAYSETEVLKLSPGTLQLNPGNAVMMGRLLRNMGSDGLTPGNVITEMPLHIMDKNMGWHVDTPEVAVKHFIRIPGSNDKYYVWPPVVSGTAVYVEAVYPSTPTPISISNWTSGTETINLPDIYINPLLQLLLFRACDMLSSNTVGMASKAAASLELAVQMIIGRKDAESETKIKSVLSQPGTNNSGPKENIV